MFLAIYTIIETLLAFLSITLISSLVSAFGYRYYALFIKNFSGAYRATATFIYVLLAPVIGLWSTVLLVFPKLSGLIIPEHCHDGICSSHSPSVALHSVIGGGFAILATIVIIILILVFYFNWQRYQRQLTTLEYLSDSNTDATYQTIDNSSLIAWNAGLWRTKIFISQGLQSLLTAKELNVIVAHEACHGIYHDNLRKLLLHWLSKMWLVNKNNVRYDFALACEQTCDAYAAKVVNKKKLVVNTIEKYTTLIALTQTDASSSSIDNGMLNNNSPHGYDRNDVNKRLHFLSTTTKSSNKRVAFIAALTVNFMLIFSQVVMFTMTYHLWLDHLLM